MCEPNAGQSLPSAPIRAKNAFEDLIHVTQLPL
jgi:hypothetical protein